MPPKKMHPDQVDVEVELVRRLVLDQFPEWADRPIEAVGSTGTVNAVYRLGDDLCLRLPLREPWSRELEKELAWLPRLASLLPLEVPRPVATGKPAVGYPFPWAVYCWLRGDTLATTPAADDEQLARDLASFVVALRRAPTSGAPGSARGRPLSERDGETRRAVGALRHLIDADATIAAWDTSLGSEAWDGDALWTHGDLLSPNLLVTSGRLSAVIDWGNVGVGDPAIDVLPAWSALGARGRRVFRSALDVDDATWTRARGFALHQAALVAVYYPETNPGFVTTALRTIDEVLADHDAS